MDNSNAKHFALQLGSLIALYVSVGALIQIFFGIITIQFPDELSYPWEYTSASSSMRLSIALLIVFFPTYIALTRGVNKARREGAMYLPLTKWLIYLSLLVGGAVLLGDLVSVIYNFLNGELTTRFLLKALTVLVVVGMAFAYYVYDAKGYWQTNEKKSIQYGFIAALIVLVAVVFGYLNIETPAEVRARTADANQISDLSTIQAEVANYYVINNALPENIDALNTGLLPSAPDGRDAYTYERTNATTFELCAEFAYPSEDNSFYPTRYIGVGEPIKNPDDWSHEAGNWCFTRVVGSMETGVIR